MKVLDTWFNNKWLRQQLGIDRELSNVIVRPYHKLTQVFVVIKDAKGKAEGREVWVFTNHDAALQCRREQKLNSHHLYGCVVDCYPIAD
jgi:hypothetical protein